MAEMVVFLQRAWHCTMLTLDEETDVYEKPCDKTLVTIVPHALEEIVAYHLSHEHLLPNEMFEVRATEYDFAGFGQWTYVQSVIRAMGTIR